MTIGPILFGLENNSGTYFIWRATYNSAPTRLLKLRTGICAQMEMKRIGNTQLVVLVPDWSPLEWWECHFTDETFTEVTSVNNRVSPRNINGDHCRFFTVGQKIFWLNVSTDKTRYAIFKVPVGEKSPGVALVKSFQNEILKKFVFIGFHRGRMMFAAQCGKFCLGAWNSKTEQLDLHTFKEPTSIMKQLGGLFFASKFSVIVGDEAYMTLRSGILVAINLVDMESRQIGEIPKDYLIEEKPGNLEKFEKMKQPMFGYPITNWSVTQAIVDNSKMTLTFCGVDNLNNRNLCYTFWCGFPSLMALCYYKLRDEEHREDLKHIHKILF